MISRNSLYHRLMVVFLVHAGLPCLPLAAETLELPVDLPLSASAVTIELWSADIDVILDPTAQPRLQARPATEEPSPAHLDSTLADGVLTILRPAETDNRGRLEVDIVIGAEQNVHLMGHDLRVTTRESRQPNVTAARGLRLTLEDSELNMEQGRDAVIVARQTSLWLSGTRGQMDLNLESGTAEIRQHGGSLKLQTSGVEVTLVDLEGKLETLLTGGSLDLRGGKGQIDGQADDVVVLLDSWHGPFSLTGDGTSLEARGTSDASRWKIVGEDLLITLEDGAGPVEAEIRGGRFDATTLGGELSLTATDGTTVELSDLVKKVTLKLFDQASARMSRLTGPLQVEMREANLQAESIGPLSLTADGSEIEVREARGQIDLSLNHCDLELDLTGSGQRSPSLVLTGAGRARVWLAAPCEVRINGQVAESYDHIGVSGCDLRLPGQPIPKRPLHGQQPPMILTVTAAPDVELEVAGQS